MTAPSLLARLVHGTQRYWLSEEYRAALPDDLAETAMALESTDRLHAKQGRTTARIRFDSPWGPLSVYLKRHQRLPWWSGLAATLRPRGRFTPAAAENAHLARARELGIPVPDVVAGGEIIGPWGRLQSFLMVAELTGCEALNEALPGLQEALSSGQFERLKRTLIAEMAGMTAALHRHHLFHKDLYLCHFFLDTRPRSAGPRLTLIDFHRMGEHRAAAFRWRWKDLGQLLFSTVGVTGINDRDRLRFWKHYRRLAPLHWPELQRRMVRTKADRYGAHNR